MKISVVICIFFLTITKACADTNNNDGNAEIRASGFFSRSCKKWCKNGGTCIRSFWGQKCSCPPGYRGNRCQFMGWGSWGSWSTCTRTCGPGFQIRHRTCKTRRGKNRCPGLSRQTRRCFIRRCSVNGNWGTWDTWSTCTKTCGPGVRIRTRACKNPPPSNGGLDCFGCSTETLECTIQPCCVDRNWGQWGQWSSCSKTCGTGTRRRTRACDNPAPANGGAQCPGTDTDSMDCNTQPCPEVDGNWGEWGQWSNCSQSCGSGIRVRLRQCNDPPPAYGGAQCDGLPIGTSFCNTQPCPVDGKWGPWGQWSSCFRICGTGTRNRTRACDYPAPAYGGADCPGSDTGSMECDTPECVEVV